MKILLAASSARADEIQRALAGASFEIHLARTAQQARLLARAHALDFAIVETAFDGENGVIVARESALPTLFIVPEHSHRPDLEQAFAECFRPLGVIVAPFSPTELLDAVQQAGASLRAQSDGDDSEE